MFKKSIIIFITLIISITFNTIANAAISEDKTDETPENASPLKGSAVKVNIKSDKIEYFPEIDAFVATGNVKITVDEDGTVIETSEVIFDQVNQLLIAENDVKITKRGIVIDGDYARFDLNGESALINNPNAYISEIKIDAKEAQLHSENVEAFNGKATINKKGMIMLLTAGATGKRNKKIFVNRPDTNTRFNYDIKAKEIIIEQKEYNNLVTLKNAEISINRFKIAKIPTLQLVADKETNRIETMLPEFGHQRELGSYFGHGHVFNLPRGATLKALPIFTFGDGENSSVGYGGMARFMNKSNKTEVFYSTLKDKIVAQGEQQIINPDTKIQYGANAYVQNGFFGRQKPKYLIEVVNKKKLVSAYNMNFNIRSSAGYAEQDRNNFSTGKFQLQGNLTNRAPYWTYEDYVQLGFSSSFSLAAYGTGDAYGVVRAGPTMWNQLGSFSLWHAYYQGAIYGETPFFFDKYRYGRSNYVFNGSVEISEYLTLGYRTSLNLSKDNWNKKLVTENQLYFWVGPEDLKFRLGYDVERAATVFGFDMMVGSEGSALEFDKLKVIQR